MSVAFQAAKRKPMKLLGQRHCGCKTFQQVQGVDGTNTEGCYIETPQVAPEIESWKWLATVGLLWGQVQYILLPCSFNMLWDTGMGWDIDPWLELCDHSYIKLNQFMSHQQLGTPTTPENLFLLWRGLPVLTWGLSISELICILLTCKPEVYKGNMEAELQCHK